MTHAARPGSQPGCCCSVPAYGYRPVLPLRRATTPRSRCGLLPALGPAAGPAAGLGVGPRVGAGAATAPSTVQVTSGALDHSFTAMKPRTAIHQLPGIHWVRLQAARNI